MSFVVTSEAVLRGARPPAQRAPSRHGAGGVQGCQGFGLGQGAATVTWTMAAMAQVGWKTMGIPWENEGLSSGKLS